MSDNEELGMFEVEKQFAREFYKGCSLTDMAKSMRDLQAIKEEQEAAIKRTNAWLDVVRLEAIPAKMDDDGIERITLDGIGRVSLTADMYVNVKDKPHLYEWLDMNGFGDIIQPTVNASTLKAFIKGRMKDGKDVPGEFLNVTPFTRASITKA